MQVLKFFAFGLAISFAEAFSSGAPTGACESLTPRHGTDLPSTSEPPYQIKVDKTEIKSGEEVTLTVETSNEDAFIGFLFQARLKADEYNVIGSFETSEIGKVIQCQAPGDTVTHVGKDRKQSISVKWKSPEEFAGTVVFTGTFVKTKEIFWVGVTSERVAVGDLSQATTPQPTQPTTTTPAPPVDTSFYNDCGSEKSCFGFPPKCVKSKSCEFTMSVVRQQDKFLFELISYQGDDAYVALALADTDQMSDATVMECVKRNGQVQTYSSWMKDRSVSRENIRQTVTQLVEGTQGGNTFRCALQRDPVTTVNEKIFDLDRTRYHLLLASGTDVNDTAIGYHDLGRIASVKESLTEIKIYGETSQIAIKLHGIFMAIAWIGTTSIGIIFARYLKASFSGRQVFGKDIWFVVHQVCMCLTWLLTMIAFVLIFVKIGRWSDAGNPHPITGLITTILCFFQPIGALFRPNPKDPKRKYFNIGHFSAGNLAHFFAILTLFYAIPLVKADIPNTLYWVFGAFAIYYLLVHVLLSFVTLKGGDAIFVQAITYFHILAVIALTVTAVVLIAV